jgi:hypothetical protein
VESQLTDDKCCAYYWAHAGLDGAAPATSNPKSTQSLSARGAGSETAVGAAKGEIVAATIEVSS